MFYPISKIWKPEIFQGHGKKGDYFEGWYFKLVDVSQKNIIAIIPGIFISKDPKYSHAFIQILNQSGKSNFIPFSSEQFWASKKYFEIRIGENIFRKDSIDLKLTSNELMIKGHIRIENPTPWPVTLTSPGCMGWYAFAPFMECYHGIVSMDHTIHGRLNINGKTIDFSDGRGYIEKDWGKSFPGSYIWIQCNHFNKPGVSLSASVANVPWLRGSFLGFIIGFLYKDVFYRFTTYSKAALQNLKVEENRINLTVVDNQFSLKINIEKGNGGYVFAPYEQQMQPIILQSLTGKVFIEFFKKEKDQQKLIFKGPANCAGVEMNGNLAEIQK